MSTLSSMSKSNITRLLIGFHFVVFAAVFLRIDTFPLTWVPMYSQFHGVNDLTVPVGNLPRRNRGLEVTLANGASDYVGAKQLNIPVAAFRRIYYERAFGKGPPKHLRERAGLNSLSEWVFNSFYEDPAISIDWQRRLIVMLNLSLRREVDDPNYIVRAVAVSDFATFGREQRRKGDVSNLNLTTRKAVIDLPVSGF